MILNALEGEPLPIYGDGGNVRDWLYVIDHCEGILLALRKGKPGRKYNIGGSNERRNVEIVDRICEVLDREVPPAKNPALSGRGISSYSALKTFVPDRPGHDRRYAIDATRIREELGWEPAHVFESGIEETVRWYLSHRGWCEKVQAGRYARERLGLAATPGEEGKE
jgi:dTDP-glucose 4,6-dehydratase